MDPDLLRPLTNPPGPQTFFPECKLSPEGLVSDGLEDSSLFDCSFEVNLLAGSSCFGSVSAFTFLLLVGVLYGVSFKTDCLASEN